MILDIIKTYFTPISILDIGANIGQFYHAARSSFPNASYTLIEGNEYCEEALKSLNTEYYISLLSDSIKSVDFYIRKNELSCTGNSIYKENTSYYSDDEILVVKKTTNTLDLLLNNRAFDLIKLDCQGSEKDIILGGSRVIERAKGLIVEISLIEFNQGSPHKDIVYSVLDDLNFIPIECLANINHPTNHSLIQQDIFFLNKKYIK